MADQMPTHWVCDVGHFLLRFLDIVLTDVSGAGGQGGLYRFGPFCFGRADDGDRFRLATTPLRCFSHSGLHAEIIGADLCCHEERVCFGSVKPTALSACKTSSIGSPTMLLYDPSTWATKAEPRLWTA